MPQRCVTQLFPYSRRSVTELAAALRYLAEDLPAHVHVSEPAARKRGVSVEPNPAHPRSDMHTQHIALVPEAGGVSPAELLRVAAALQKQVGSQFGPLWDVHASVDAFLELEELPAGYAPILVSPPDRIDRDLSLHLDQNGQPFARVRLGPTWSIHASRACLELLINPYGRRTLSAPSPRTDQGPADVLVEACGAFGSCPVAYAVNDVAVADFCTPAFYRTSAHHVGERYSFCGSLAVPLQLLRGGRLAWFDAVSNSWWLRSAHDGHTEDIALGKLPEKAKTPRELVEQHLVDLGLPPPPADMLYSRVRWRFLCEQAQAASRARAHHLRERLGMDIGDASGALERETPAAAQPAQPERHTLQTFPPPLPLPHPVASQVPPAPAATPEPTFAVDQAYADEARLSGRAEPTAADDQTPVLGTPLDVDAASAKPQPEAPASAPPSLTPVTLLDRPAERRGPHFGVLAVAALLLGAGIQYVTRDDAAATPLQPPAHAMRPKRARQLPAVPAPAPDAVAPVAPIAAHAPAVRPDAPPQRAATELAGQEARAESGAKRMADAASRRERRAAAQEASSEAPVTREAPKEPLAERTGPSTAPTSERSEPERSLRSAGSAPEPLAVRSDAAPAPVTAAPLPPSIEDLIDSRR